jgi:hypothetical protein
LNWQGLQGFPTRTCFYAAALLMVKRAASLLALIGFGEPSDGSASEFHELSVVFTTGTEHLGLLDEVWVAGHNLVKQRLGLEPSAQRRANELASLNRHVVRYQFRRSRRHRNQLCLT